MAKSWYKFVSKYILNIDPCLQVKLCSMVQSIDICLNTMHNEILDHGWFCDSKSKLLQGQHILKWSQNWLLSSKIFYKTKDLVSSWDGSYLSWDQPTTAKPRPSWPHSPPIRAPSYEMSWLVPFKLFVLYQIFLPILWF